ncbi:MAG TPA: protein-methionine-sulfoxide reductase catalytic subunit MsrP [Phycisphaerae bacterium]|jgi:sulfoxide reductase catalytic subunit YedY
MSGKFGDDIPSSQITPKQTYLDRRTFLRAAGLVGGIVAAGGLYKLFNPTPGKPVMTGEKIVTSPTETVLTNSSGAVVPSGFTTDEPKTPFDSIAGYNNFYEFSTSKEAVAELAKGFVSRPWTIAVGGLVSKPQTVDIEAILKRTDLQERIYRHRCVEGWSMVIPWLGFSLAALLKEVEPLSAAKYVAFETLLDSARMPNQDSDVLPWPYVEGLRMDEAMHPLAMLAVGLYGETLPPQNGAPVKLVVPWKYGFKGCKSIVKITLVKDMPPTTWNMANPSEYGFYSNVNPDVDHPRWSQKTERRLPDFSSRPTLPFNGYAQQVASLYTGMDLVKNF